MTTFEPGGIIKMSREENENMESKMVTPTAGLRFVERDGKWILQQLYEIKLFKGIMAVGLEGEWRDVPLVENP